LLWKRCRLLNVACRAPRVALMPSAEHESPIALAKLDPGLVAWLLSNVFDIKVPDYHHARAQPSDVRVLVPRTYHADGMLLFCDAADHPLLAVVLEVQRKRVIEKRRTWKLYVAQLELELDVSTALVVYCPTVGLANYYRGLLEFDGISLRLQPLIFTPQDVPLVVDVDVARANPALAVLAAICHGDHQGVDAAFPALAEALQSLGTKSAFLYYDIVLAGLPMAPRTRWEAFVTTTVGSEYYSERLRTLSPRTNRSARRKARQKARQKERQKERQKARRKVWCWVRRGRCLRC
jgi:hypothetical protein